MTASWDWPATWRGALRGVAVFAASRAVVLLSFGTATVIKGSVPFKKAIGFWDGGWYLSIINPGYNTTAPAPGQPSNLAFFPLYPLAIRVTSRVTGLSLFRASIVLNVVFGLVVAGLLWVLASRLGDQPFADRCVALFSFFPASFVLSMGYSEPLMLVFAVVCLIALVERQWLIAGLAAAIATAARPNAIALCAACAVGSALAIKQRREWKSLLAPALSPLGLVAFSVYLRAHTGDPLVWLDAQRAGWKQGLDFGAAMARAAGHVAQHPGRDLNELVATLSLVFVIGAFVALARWRPPAVLTTFAVVVIALGYLSPALSSRPRFALTAFPLVFAVARFTRGLTFYAALGVSAVLLGTLGMISVTTIAITP